MIGPPVGAKIPGFTASDQNGQPHTLESLMGPAGVMLVFHRSADW
jgi:peroxiredoxin